ncbi:hypothetical protein BDB00DRAFT_619609 [Zychaea mexicana]|uniref:uncharacterized protein n=1 Tax=Zychaea mexicana TaxID=64656 RepID=UPI0022FDEDF9|nr:uncharacterized protein BDB00DRAFT_619609 [Zychaea mexicana]KAI9489371.1 hypothetical protein BDB00DRAFT_619609 [Zychaea mexicana]
MHVLNPVSVISAIILLSLLFACTMDTYSQDVAYTMPRSVEVLRKIMPVAVLVFLYYTRWVNQRLTPTTTAAVAVAITSLINATIAAAAVMLMSVTALTIALAANVLLLVIGVAKATATEVVIFVVGIVKATVTEVSLFVVGVIKAIATEASLFVVGIIKATVTEVSLFIICVVKVTATEAPLFVIGIVKVAATALVTSVIPAAAETSIETEPLPFSPSSPALPNLSAFFREPEEPTREWLEAVAYRRPVPVHPEVAYYKEVLLRCEVRERQRQQEEQEYLLEEADRRRRFEEHLQQLEKQQQQQQLEQQQLQQQQQLEQQMLVNSDYMDWEQSFACSPEILIKPVRRENNENLEKNRKITKKIHKNKRRPNMHLSVVMYG